MTSKRKAINNLFKGAEDFIPPEILDLVQSYILAVYPKFDLNLETIEDLVQVCLRKIWILAREFKSKPPIYFVGVAHNTLVDGYREQVRLSRLDAKLKEGFIVNEKKMMRDALRKIYSKVDFDALIRSVLSDEERAVIIMKCAEDKTFRQISLELDLSPSTVKRRHSTALQKLRSKLRPVAPERHEENVEINP